VTKHLQTRKHQYALEQYQRKQDEEQAAKSDPQPVFATHFSSPNLDPSPVPHPPNPFHGLRRLDDMWIDDAGNELTFPHTLTQDETWTSQRAQDFWREVEDAMAGECSVDPEIATMFDGTDIHDHEPEIPSSFSASEAREYSPYPSKTVSRKCRTFPRSCYAIGEPSNTYIQMFILDLLDNKPRLQLSDEHMRSILWALKELGVANVPSLKKFRGMQKVLAEKINVVPHHHVSAMGNHFYQNSPGTLLALVSYRLHCPSIQLISPSHRIGPIHLSVTRSSCTLRSPQKLQSFGRQESGWMRFHLRN
jgi:hypothetical protein